MSIVLPSTGGAFVNSVSLTPNNVTIVGRFKTSSATKLFVVAAKASGIATHGLGIDASNHSQASSTNNAATNAVGNSGTTYTNATWSSGVAAFASTTSRTAYVNGGTGTANTTSVPTPATIDQYYLGYAGAVASLADIGIYDAVMTAAERLSFYCGFSPGYIKTANLRTWVPGVSDLSSTGGLTWTNDSSTFNAGDHPTVSALTIPAAGTTIVLTTAQAITLGAGGGGGLVLTLSGGACTATYSSGSTSTTLTYTLSRTVLAGETGTATYTNPTNGWQNGSADLSTITSMTIVNSSTAGPLLLRRRRMAVAA